MQSRFFRKGDHIWSNDSVQGQAFIRWMRDFFECVIVIVIVIDSVLNVHVMSAHGAMFPLPLGSAPLWDPGSILDEWTDVSNTVPSQLTAKSLACPAETKQAITKTLDTYGVHVNTPRAYTQHDGSRHGAIKRRGRSTNRTQNVQCRMTLSM